MNWSYSFSQTDTLKNQFDLRKIRAELLQCDSIKVWFHNSKLEAFSLRNAIITKEQENSILLEANENLFYENFQLKQDIEKEKSRKKKLGIGLGIGVGAAVGVAILSFFIK